MTRGNFARSASQLRAWGNLLFFLKKCHVSSSRVLCRFSIIKVYILQIFGTKLVIFDSFFRPFKRNFHLTSPEGSLRIDTIRVMQLFWRRKDTVLPTQKAEGTLCDSEPLFNHAQCVFERRSANESRRIALEDRPNSSDETLLTRERSGIAYTKI